MQQLTFIDLQHLLIIKLLFFAFIGVGIWAIHKKKSPAFFVILGAIFCAASYAIMVNDLELMFWGLKGDEITIAAMYEQFAHGSLFADYNYAHLPPFYPPLFFQFFALFGRVFGWNGVVIAKVASTSTILFFPVIIYYIQKWYWRDVQRPELRLGPLAWALSAAFIFVFSGWDAVITKPYEFVSGTGVVLWTAFLLMDLHGGQLHTKRMLGYGIVGAVLFTTFYFWFFLSAIAIALYNLFSVQKITAKMYAHLALIGVIILVIAAPYWLPLAHAYATHGAENWQLGFFEIKLISKYIPGFPFTFQSITALFGLSSLIYFRDNVYIRAVLTLFCAAIVWQIMGFVTIILFASPMLESKGLLFFSTAALAFGSAYGIERMWNRYKDTYQKQHLSIAILSLLLIAPQLIFGNFLSSAEFYGVRERARRMNPELKELVQFFKAQNMENKVVLTSGIPEAHAFLPFREFAYFNQHNSHPAALFSSRMLAVQGFTQVGTAEEFYDTIRNNEFEPIDLLVLYKEKGQPDFYPLYFNVDGFPNGIEHRVLYLPKRNVEHEHIHIIYENDAYIVYRVE